MNDYARVYHALADQVRARGFDLYHSSDWEMGGIGSRGVTKHDCREVHLLDSLPVHEVPGVLAHELAHVILHDKETLDTQNIYDYMMWERRRHQREVEAEGVALVVMQRLGLTETVPFSVDYIRTWSNRGALAPDTDEIINRTANLILDGIYGRSYA